MKKSTHYRHRGGVGSDNANSGAGGHNAVRIVWAPKGHSH